MKPERRREGLVLHELTEEVLVYDLDRHKAFCLGRTISSIWSQCTGQRMPSEIAQTLEAELGAPVGEDLIHLALHRLGKARLLRDPIGPLGESASHSRRQLLRRAAMLGGLTVLAVSAPTAGQAATCLPTGTCVNSHCMDSRGNVCCAGASACRQNSMVCGTGQTGFQCG